MTLDAAALQRLSALLDEALDLPEAGREAWLASLSGEAATLGPTLRKMLLGAEPMETGDLLARGPAFTAPAEAPGGVPGGLSGEVLGEAPAMPDFAVGVTVGPYRLLRALGRGGMGEVWLAERTDGQLRRTVALKLPMLGLRRNVLVQRFARERDILGSLAHPNIARLYDAGLADDGQPYLALEYVEGRPLTDHCEAERVDLRGRVQLLMQVAQAVQYAHAHLVIHRDLKPGNVLVRADGQAMLLDFGIAKLVEDEQGEAAETELTRVGGRALTLAYAAPEQVSGAPVSTATDVYALGVLLYELLAGARPFKGTPREVEDAVLHREPARPAGVPADLATVVLKALKKLPAERYATAYALGEDLARWLAGEPVQAQADRMGYRLRKFVGRHRLGVAGAAGVALAVLGVGAAALWQAGVAQAQARRAQQQEARALAVQDFMLGLFRANADAQPDPLRARATTARELLDIGAARVRRELDGVPEVKDAVLSTLMAMYGDVGLNAEAADLAGERVALREKLYGADDLRVAQALVDQAHAVDSTSASTRGPPLLERARVIVERNPDAPVDLRLRVLFAQAQVARYIDVSTSLGYVQEARALMQRSGTTGDPLRRALYLEGLNLGFLGACADGLQRLEEAHRLSLASSGPQPRWQIPENTAIFSNALCVGRFDRAEAALQDALAMSQRLNGPDHVDTTHVRLRLMRLFSDTSRAAEAREIEARLRPLLEDAAVQRDANLSSTLLRALALRAWDEGRLEAADTLSLRLVASYRSYTGASLVLATAMQMRALVVAARGRPDEAARDLDAAEVMLRKALGARATPTGLAAVRIDQAAVDLAAGRPVEALARLDAVRAELPAAAPEARPLLPRLARWRAAALRESGRAAEAADAAQAGLQALAPPLRASDLPHLRSDLGLERGLALQALGRHAEARDALAAALALRAASDDASSVWRARIERALAEVAHRRTATGR